MAASVFDSQHLNKLFQTGDIAALFTDSAEMRALLLVEGALAKVQGELGVIPEISGIFLHRASMEVQIDPSGLAEATGRNGVSIPAFVAALRKTLEAPEHGQYLHWGATSQDILDTALMLRLKRAFGHIETTLKAHVATLATLAEQTADTPIVARTWGQHATPTTLGAIVAAWGRPLLSLCHEYEARKATAFWVSLSGASGTGAALGSKAGETRAALAKALALHDPEYSWHSDRTPLTWLASWATRLVNSLSKMATDLADLSMTEIAEVSIGEAGGSSTMPQKQNPIGAGTIMALATHVTALNGVLQSAACHKHQRDGAAWITEWLSLPQLVLGTGATLVHATRISTNLTFDAQQARSNLERSHGLIFAEALSFALAAHMPRPEAQARTKELCIAATKSGRTLAQIATQAYPDIDFGNTFQTATQTGAAPQEARAFVAAASSL